MEDGGPRMRQSEVLDYLKGADGPKTVIDMCEAFGIAYPENRNSVHKALGKLVKWGEIRRVGTVRTSHGATATLWEVSE